MNASHQLSTKSQASLLSEKLEVGVVKLKVKSLELEKRFYKDLVGLELVSESENVVTLGWQNHEIIQLHKNSKLPYPNQHQAGLYHLAILFAERGELAQALKRIFAQHFPLFTGSSDHLVSEAFYFHDPEGNGVELYYDRDPKSWVWQDGTIIMGSKYIDPHLYIQEYSQKSPSSQKKLGHIHLKVGDIEKAKHFYVDILGMSVTFQTSTALFVSDGKYHHTLGMNIWESEGAGSKDDVLGLDSFTLLLSGLGDLDLLAKRLHDNGYSYRREVNEIELHDPWGNKIDIIL